MSGKAISIFALIFACLAMVLAQEHVDDDVRCVVYSDDCGQCLSNGCGWCDEGFCTAIKSEICPAEKISTSVTSCPAKKIVERQTVDCSSISPESAGGSFSVCTPCTTAGCALCVDNTILTWRCRARAAGGEGLCAVISAYEYTFPPGLSLVLTSTNLCPSGSPGSSVSGQIRFYLSTSVPLNVVYLQELIALLYRTLSPGDQLTVFQIIVDSFKTVTLRQSTQAREAIVRFTSTSTQSATNIANTFAGSINNGSVSTTVFPVVGGVTGVSTGLSTSGTAAPTTGTVAPTTSGTGSTDGNDGLDLSRGALAGIIIGSVLGGMLIIAIIAFLIFRSRENYPMPFRSPAAAYRP